MRLVEVQVPATLSVGSTVTLREAIASDEALLLRGEGSVFCRGLDPGPSAAADLEPLARMLLDLRGRPSPTVAFVEGETLGGGVGLAAACDLVLAHPDARFGLPELVFGLTPAIVWPFLRERVLPQPLRRLALTGESIGASEAARLGLVDVVASSCDPTALRRTLSRTDASARSHLKSLPATMEAEILAGCRLTAALRASPAAEERRARFEAGETPWVLT
ncbi:MAG: enoyl-CoA hydratase/isomerase family protein [Deltaproteobacteria bacterium]|nr:enoyl-CoA hydratase/isomerase family protein [Deltaproteobacteria bacterium]